MGLCCTEIYAVRNILLLSLFLSTYFSVFKATGCVVVNSLQMMLFLNRLDVLQLCGTYSHNITVWYALNIRIYVHFHHCSAFFFFFFSSLLPLSGPSLQASLRVIVVSCLLPTPGLLSTSPSRICPSNTKSNSSAYHNANWLENCVKSVGAELWLRWRWPSFPFWLKA